MGNPIEATEEVFQRFSACMKAPAQGVAVVVPVQFRNGGAYVTITRAEWDLQQDADSRRALTASRLKTAERQVNAAAARLKRLGVPS